MRVRAFLNDVLGVLLPARCPGCGWSLGRRRGLCAACTDTLRGAVSAHSPLRRRAEPHLVTLGEYRGVVRRAVRALKYGGARDVAVVLAAPLAGAVPPEWGVQAVCAVPLHRSRSRGRAFNQAELLAREVAGQLGVPCLPLLTRVRSTRQQARLRAHQRRENVAGAFSAGAFSGPVLLVDDVLTTGETLRACQAALVAAGAGPVYVAVAAR